MDIGVLSVSEISDNIKAIYDRKRAAVVALCNFYATKAVKIFNDNQKNSAYWNNQTFQAKNNVFGGDIDEKDFVGFFLAHGKEYGIYLELSDDRKNEALRPIINSLWADFKKDLQEIYG